jgi:hypothetical protein
VSVRSDWLRWIRALRSVTLFVSARIRAMYSRNVSLVEGNAKRAASFRVRWMGTA